MYRHAHLSGLFGCFYRINYRAHRPDRQINSTISHPELSQPDNFLTRFLLKLHPMRSVPLPDNGMADVLTVHREIVGNPFVDLVTDLQ